MDFIQAIILGIVQGLTEFLPISSSGHLILIPQIAKWDYMGKAFDVALHVGTFISLLIYYRETIVKIFKDWVGTFKELKTPKVIFDNPEKRLPWLILMTVIPGGLVGVFLEDVIEKYASGPMVTSICLIVFGMVLCIAESYSKRLTIQERPTSENVNFMQALIIGLAQACALVPGMSRSGITMTAGMFLGMKKDQAANFSFLISFPIIGGAAVYSGLKLVTHPELMTTTPMIFLVGIITSAITGYFVIKFLLNFIKKDSFAVFMYYRIVLGLIIMGMFFFGKL